MILSREDLDFLQGFVKAASDHGATEEQAAVLLHKAYPIWKTRTTGTEALNLLKQSGAFTQAVKGIGKNLMGLGGNTIGAAYHGVRTPLAAIARNPGRSAAAAGGAALVGGAGYGINKGLEAWNRKDNYLNPDGFTPGQGGSGSSSSSSGPGTYEGSQYSPHGAYIQNKLDSYANEGSVDGAASGRRQSGGGAQGGSQWDREFQSGQAQIKGYDGTINGLRAQLTAVSNSGLDPVAQEREVARIKGEISTVQSAADKARANLGARDTSLQNQQAHYSQARAENLQTLATQLPIAQEQANQWAAAQRQAREATGFLPRTYYSARNWLTGNSNSDGDAISKRIQGMRAAQGQLSAQPANYFHNAP